MTIKTVVITGGSRGIGLEIARAFVCANYHVVVGARNFTEGLKVMGSTVQFIETDVRYETAHVQLVNTALNQTGRIDCYINNAGYSAWRPIDKIDEVFLDELLATNLKGAFWGCKAAA